MEEPLLARITARRSAEIVTRFAVEFDEEAAALLSDEQSPADFLRTLLEHQQDLDAIRFLAHALPKREAVWWACACARDALGEAPSAATVGALEAAESWVKQPDDAGRRAAEAAAEASGMEGAAAFAAMAAFLSNGSIAPAELDPVEPADNLTGRMVASAVLVAAQAFEPARAAEKHRAYLAMGIEIAKGPPRPAAG